ncbi:MAG TPA: Crp/Fnr family transcriptional regulator, partial [Acidimicrobiia bacterium]|nr:Crp/Fnr family transcriptional regulator [Acidimicrobiia bacterium]
LFPPYRTRFGAVALTTVELLVIDARTLRARLDEDAALGYALLQRFSRVIAERLEATRLQLLDVYGNQRAAGG